MSNIKNRSGAANTRPANGLSLAGASNNRGHFTPTAGNLIMSEAERRRRLSAVYSILLEAADTAENGQNENREGGNQ